MTALFIFSIIILTGIALAFVLIPLLRKKQCNHIYQPVEISDLYARKIEELKLDMESGIISEDEYQHALVELKRSLLIDSEDKEMVDLNPPSKKNNQPVTKSTGSSIPAAIVLAVMVPLVAVSIYMIIGGGAGSLSTAAANTQTVAETSKHPGMNHAGDMSDMVQRLEQRLENQPADPDGWALLVRSYYYLNQLDQMKRTVARARSHGFNIPLPEKVTMPVTGDMPGNGIESLKQLVKKNPDDANAWNKLGHAFQKVKKFQSAAEAYAKALAIRKNDPDLLADYADVLAMSRNRSLQGEPLNRIHQALALDPDHVKSLWLAATAALEVDNKATAKKYWLRLLRILPQNSMDRKVIEANLAELEGTNTSGSKDNENVSPSEAGIRGTVSLASNLTSQVDPSDTVFIFAQAEKGPKMPLAVMRKQAGELPISFTLDDSMAMRPDLKLSTFDKIIITAKVSKTGNALTDSYLKATSGVINARNPSIINLILQKEGGIK